MATYLHERNDWPDLAWRHDALEAQLGAVRHRQGRLIGRMEGLGLGLREEAHLRTLTEDVTKTSEIEGEHLDRKQVRSSIARKLGMDIGGLTPSDRNVDGVVGMLVDATSNFGQPLTKNRIFSWHTALFPTGRSGLEKIRVGKWRDDKTGPMQVVSGSRLQRVHFEAPTAGRLDAEIKAFLKWFEAKPDIDPVLKAGLAHLRFVTIHPFQDGNGRIARAIADMGLARSENSGQRFYSMSSQICSEAKAYYEILEATQRGGCDVTAWLQWFLGCLDRAFDRAEGILGNVLDKAAFWERFGDATINDRQRIVLNRLLDGFEGKLTSSKYATLAKTSPDTALRDIDALIKAGMLVKEAGGGRSTSYALAERADAKA